MVTIKRSVIASGRGEGEMNSQSKRFWGSENTPYDIIMTYTYHYMIFQTYRMYNTKSEAYCKSQTLGDYMPM